MRAPGPEEEERTGGSAPVQSFDWAASLQVVAAFIGVAFGSLRTLRVGKTTRLSRALVHVIEDALPSYLIHGVAQACRGWRDRGAASRRL